MKTVSLGNRSFRRRLFLTVRACVTGLLLALVALEILPVGYLENPPLASCEDGDRGIRIEPLQVCGSGDPLLGGLFDVPVLLPGAPCVILSSEALPLLQHAAAFVPDGFHPVIDHPPRHSA